MRGNSRSREREKKTSYMKVSYISASFANTDFPGGSNGKASVYNAGDPGSIPGLGRSPGEGNVNPLQYSYLEIPQTEERGMLQPMRSQRVGHDQETKQQ